MYNKHKERLEYWKSQNRIYTAINIIMLIIVLLLGLIGVVHEVIQYMGRIL
jgi:uncharacterized membrane protein YkgB